MVLVNGIVKHLRDVIKKIENIIPNIHLLNIIMSIIFEKRVILVETDRLVKVLETVIYNDNTITFSYICNNGTPFVEASRIIRTTESKMRKFRNIMTEFPPMEVYKLEPYSLINFLITIINNL